MSFQREFKLDDLMISQIETDDDNDDLPKLEDDSYNLNHGILGPLESSISSIQISIPGTDYVEIESLDD